METAVKVENDSANHSGRVEYRYCLSCDGALSERIEREAGSGEYTPIVSWQRYEYHGLDLMRVDERYDNDTPADGIDSSDPWRTLEVSTHRPGAIGSLLGKRVYTHTNNDATPDTTEDFLYTYDPVGNVVSVVDDSGDEAYHFTQEAFGNELPVNVLGGSDWDDAADDRILEHQTGKWRDEFTGLYYFWARWYDGEVGRFVARDPLEWSEEQYRFVENNPISNVDPKGLVCGVVRHKRRHNLIKGIIGHHWVEWESAGGWGSGSAGFWPAATYTDEDCFDLKIVDGIVKSPDTKYQGAAYSTDNTKLKCSGKLRYGLQANTIKCAHKPACSQIVSCLFGARFQNPFKYGCNPLSKTCIGYTEWLLDQCCLKLE